MLFPLNKGVFILFPLCLSVLPAFAACHVVTPAGAGSHSGADWSNAYAGIPSTLTRGDIYYLADGNYSNYNFNTPTSGTATVEIRKAQTYDNCTGTGWNASTMGSSQAVFPWTSSHGIITFSTSYVTINGNGNGAATEIGCGGVAANPPATFAGSPPNLAACGIKIDASTCAGGSLNVCTGGTGEMNGGGQNITWESVEWKGAGSNATGNLAEPYFWFASGGNLANITITHSYLHNAGCTYFTDVSGGWNNGVFSYNYLWGLYDSSTNHSEAIQLQGSQSGTVVHHNVFRDQITNGDLVAVISGTQNNFAFYDNVDWCTTPGACRHNDGIIGCFNSQVCTNFKVYNNDIVNVSGTDSGVNISGGAGTMTIYNNIWYNSSTPTFTGGTITSDYNSYLNSGGSAHGSHDIVASSAPNPFVNLAAGNFSIALENADWTNRLSLGSPYDIDAAGNALTTDRGAYQFGSQVTVQPPTGLTSLSQ